MLLRLFLMLSLLSQLGEDARDESELGGKGFANVVFALFLIGVVVLAVVVTVMLLALNGHYLNDYLRPLT